MRGWGAAAVLAGALGTSAPASTAAADDGAYGRLDGDVDLAAGAGVAVMAGAPGLAARLSAVYLATAGLYVGYAESFGQAAAAHDRSIAAGVALRPLFWGRFANALERGPARLDLFVDSLSLEIGAFWAAPRGEEITAEPGLELAAGLGFPFFASATGPFVEVRGALRFRRVDLDASSSTDLLERGAMLTITLAWHHVLAAHIVDAGDRLRR